MENMLHDNEVEGMPVADIPKSGTWLNMKVQLLKTQGKLSVNDLIINT